MIDTANMLPPKHIAFFRLSALGDVVLAIPMIRALQNQWPDCKITWITSSAAYPLLEGLEGVEFLVIQKPKTFKDYLGLRKLFKQYEFDVLIAAQASFRTNLLYPFIKAKRKIGFDNGRARDLHAWFVKEQIPAADEHLAEGFMGFAKYLGVQSDELTWSLYTSEEDQIWAAAQRQTPKQEGGKYIAINAAASKAERTWKAEHYAELINQAVEKYHCQVVLTGGPADNEIQLAKTIQSLAKHPVDNLVGQTKHKQIAALLGEVDCLIAPDTGPAHIAVAMHTPVIGLYAVARSELSGPYQAPNYTVDAYPLAVEKYLGKPAAEAGWHERVHHKDAMDLITVEDVMAQLGRVLMRNN
ncbi:glycosyltransferase family 9 protein [Oceaniserpentilla sp. 4NH20-0058]|uniref:glycosyltransferase family 9 protein n=1 Tax=Oceaniserpentilla sp. 4NH20-0058 TaxID=3127660 RepID=UPI003341F503